MSRPTIFTEFTVQKLEQAFRDGFSVVEACRTSGISKAAYYQHLAEDEEFMDKMRTAQDYIVTKAKHVIVGKIKDGDATAARWWLEHRAKDEFGSKALTNTEIDERDQLTENIHSDIDPLAESIKVMKELLNATVDRARAEDAATQNPIAQPKPAELTTSHLDNQSPVKPLAAAIELVATDQPPAYDTRFDVMADLYE